MTTPTIPPFPTGPEIQAASMHPGRATSRRTAAITAAHSTVAKHARLSGELAEVRKALEAAPTRNDVLVYAQIRGRRHDLLSPAAQLVGRVEAYQRATGRSVELEDEIRAVQGRIDGIPAQLAALDAEVAAEAEAEQERHEAHRAREAKLADDFARTHRR